MDTDASNELEATFTNFVLSMVMASVLSAPSIIAMSYLVAMRRILKS